MVTWFWNCSEMEFYFFPVLLHLLVAHSWCTSTQRLPAQRGCHFNNNFIRQRSKKLDRFTNITIFKHLSNCLTFKYICHNIWFVKLIIDCIWERQRQANLVQRQQVAHRHRPHLRILHPTPRRRLRKFQVILSKIMIEHKN